ELPQRRCGVEAALSRHQKCRLALAARDRMDHCHGPVCHPVWRTLPCDKVMMRQPSIRQPVDHRTCSQQCSRPASPLKAGLRPPPPAAKGLDRACCPARIGCRAFDGRSGRRQNAPCFDPVTEAAYTEKLTFPPHSIIHFIEEKDQPYASLLLPRQRA